MLRGDLGSRPGLPAAPGDKLVILEAFKPGTEPSLQEGARSVIDGNSLNAVADSPVAGPGGLY